MSENGASPASDRSPEERAEELMERTARALGKFVGRAREELEDIVAEARTLRQEWREPRSK